MSSLEVDDCRCNSSTLGRPVVRFPLCSESGRKGFFLRRRPLIGWMIWMPLLDSQQQSKTCCCYALFHHIVCIDRLWKEVLCRREQLRQQYQFCDPKSYHAEPLLVEEQQKHFQLWVKESSATINSFVVNTFHFTHLRIGKVQPFLVEQQYQQEVL